MVHLLLDPNHFSQAILTVSSIVFQKSSRHLQVPSLYILYYKCWGTCFIFSIRERAHEVRLCKWFNAVSSSVLIQGLVPSRSSYLGEEWVTFLLPLKWKALSMPYRTQHRYQRLIPAEMEQESITSGWVDLLPPIEEWLEDELTLLHLCTPSHTNLQSNSDGVSLNKTHQVQAA